MNLRKKIILVVATVAFSNAGIGHADPVSVTATLTADNHYVLYYGTEDATSLIIQVSTAKAMESCF